MKKVLENITKILIYGTFFVPLVVVPSSFIFPFIVPKILLLRSLIMLLIVSYAALLLINWREYKPKFTVLNMVLIFFLLSFFLSTFLGVDAYHSFWDNHERMLGFFTIFHYIAYYFIVSAVFKNWMEWKLALKIFLGAGTLVMLIGFAQKADPSFLMNQGSGRVASTLGNAIYVGGYGLFLIFSALLLFFEEKSPFWKAVMVGLGVIAFLGMIFSGTRGSLLGFLTGTFFALAGYAIILKNSPKIRKVSLIILTLSAVFLAVLYVNKEKSIVQNVPVLGRLLNISFSAGTADTRMIAWEIALKGWKERPILGWGPNNFFYAFNKYYNPKFLEHGFGETWFDNAHNILMNTLTVQGTFGILTYLSLFVVSIVVLLRSYKRGSIDINFLAVGVAFLVAHLVNNVFVFENPTSYLYFFFFLALLNGNCKKPEELKEQKLNNEISIGLLAVVFSFMFIVLYATDINPARANQATLNAIKAINSGDSPALQYENATKIPSPHIDDIRNDFSRSVIEKLGEYIKANRQEEVNELYKLVYQELAKNLELHPLDIRIHLQLANLTSQFMNMENKDAFVNVELLLEDALSKSPARQQVKYMLADVKVILGKELEAEKILVDSFEISPKVEFGLFRLIALEQQLGKLDKGLEYLNYAFDNGIVLSEAGENYLKGIYPDFDFNKNK